MVATEAAGEGINLQFCHLMVNYDIPWNPNRLEQRMGRIHRIGQTEDVYIFNLVATNTREGYVLNVLLKKMEKMGVAIGDKVFDVVGQALGTNLREMLEAVIAGEMTKEEAAADLRRRGGGPGHQGSGGANCSKVPSPATTWTGRLSATEPPARRSGASRRATSSDSSLRPSSSRGEGHQATRPWDLEGRPVPRRAGCPEPDRVGPPPDRRRLRAADVR